jgi:hypothetical protein
MQVLLELQRLDTDDDDEDEDGDRGVVGGSVLDLLGAIPTS